VFNHRKYSTVFSQILMRLTVNAFVLLTLITIACAGQPPVQQLGAAGASYIGFDSNDYPGDDALPTLRRHFAFAGYWLTNPPGEHQNSWKGKREAMLHADLGFLVLANGRLEAEIGKAKRSGTSPVALAEKDAALAVANARSEDFPLRTIIFLDQEEGGRLTPDQSAYLLAWTEAVAHSGYLPGVYASGQPVGDGPGKTITTVQDIREQVAAKHLHEIAIWVYQDACPPANGCTLQAPPLSASDTADVVAWQYAQSPRRKAITAACRKTYAADGNCYVSDVPTLQLDLSAADSPDPSHGR
jgi:Domain of unknown function (DUF1906)